MSRIRTHGMRLAALGLIVVSLATPMVASAATSSQPRDNDKNSIMWGGAYSKSEWLDKVNKGDGHNSAADIQHVYFSEGHGITRDNFANTVDGTVTNDGKVYVGGKLVATEAHVQGRGYTTGSTKDGTVYSRPIPDPERPAGDTQAWVNMDGGVYHYAILKACGNTVRGKAVPKPTPTPTPTKTPKPTPSTTPKPTPEQSFSCVQLTPTQPDKVAKPSTFRFTITPANKNVTVTGYRFNFGDNSPMVDNDAKTNYVDHAFPAGTWTVQGQVKTSAGITAVSQACSATVTVNQPQGGGQVLAAYTTPTLPATGAETALGGAAGITAIGVASRAYLRSRKSLLEAMRGKFNRK